MQDMIKEMKNKQELGVTPLAVRMPQFKINISDFTDPLNNLGCSAKNLDLSGQADRCYNLFDAIISETEKDLTDEQMMSKIALDIFNFKDIGQNTMEVVSDLSQALVQTNQLEPESTDSYIYLENGIPCVMTTLCNADEQACAIVTLNDTLVDLSDTHLNAIIQNIRETDKTNYGYLD